MASITDAANAVVAAVAAALYPDGVDPDNPNSAAGMPCKVYMGWPLPKNLDDDMAAGTVNVSVFPRPGERITSRYFEQWQMTIAPNPTLTLTVVDQTVMVGGTVSLPQVCAIIANGIGYPYEVQEGDSLDDIAAGLAALIAVDLPDVTVDGTAVTLPNTAIINDVRLGAAGTAVREIRRQEKQMQVSVWAPTPASRDAVAKVIDLLFARRQCFSDPDGLAISAVYNGSNLIDEKQKQVIYRQDFMLTVEYGTAEKQQQMQIVVPVVNVSGNATEVIP